MSVARAHTRVRYTHVVYKSESQGCPASGQSELTLNKSFPKQKKAMYLKDVSFTVPPRQRVSSDPGQRLGQRMSFVLLGLGQNGKYHTITSQMRLVVMGLLCDIHPFATSHLSVECTVTLMFLELRIKQNFLFFCLLFGHKIMPVIGSHEGASVYFEVTLLFYTTYHT